MTLNRRAALRATAVTIAAAATDFSTFGVSTSHAMALAQVSDELDGPSGIEFELNSARKALVNVQDFGAIGDGVTGAPSSGTNDIDAFANAVRHARESGINGIYVPPGVYKLEGSIDLGDGDMSIIGAGQHLTILYHLEELNTHPDDLFFNTDAPVAYAPYTSTDGTFHCQDLTIRGTRNTSKTKNMGVVTFRLSHYRRVSFVNVGFVEHNFFPNVIRFTDEVTWLNCYAENCARDVFRAIDCYSAAVIGCRAQRIGDDVVSLHVATGTELLTNRPKRQSAVIIGNHFMDCRSIKVLGGRGVQISDNKLERMHTQAIKVQKDDGTWNEGGLNKFALSITNNQIFDSLETGSNGVIQITQLKPRGTTASSNAVPGFLDADGIPVETWDFNHIYTDSTQLSAAPTLHTRNVDISGNLIIRTLPSVSRRSMWGYGPRLVAGIESDPPVSEDDLTPGFGITIGNAQTGFAGVSQMTLQRNQISGTSQGIQLWGPSAHTDYEEISIAENIIHDCHARGISVRTAAFSSMQCAIERNQINLDPLRRHANSNGDGSYMENGGPEAIRLDANSGWIIRHNTIRNCCRMFVAADRDQHIVDGNVVFCDPHAEGFDVANVGVGEILNVTEGFDYVVIDADPTSDTYGQLQNIMVKSARSRPTSGKYLRGHFVKNRTPSAIRSRPKRTILTGWIRLTTGTTHNPGDDWGDVLALTE